MAEYIALCAKRQCQRWQAPFSRRACLCHAVRHYRDKVMFDCRPAYLAMIFSTFEPVRRM